MTVLQRYFAAEILRSVLFVLIAFLALFAFFDLIAELQAIGKGGYELQHAFLYVLLGLPGYTYELMPIAALIGTIYALAQFASRSEFTIMRAASMSTVMAGWMLARIGLVLVLLTFLIGEFVAPTSTRLAETLKLRTQGSALSQGFRTGLWTKDVIRSDGISGDQIGSRFLNVSELRTDGQLRGVKIYELDREFRMTALILAESAEYAGAHVWRLKKVVSTRFPSVGFENETASRIAIEKLPSKDMVSEITPEILSVLFADPDRMSAVDLAAYTKHLEANKQGTERYEIAFWKKVIYPFAILVMMAMALPFAYLHFRSGGVSLKIFTGIMIGVSFQLINSLFSHLGLLNTWPAFITAAVPSALFLLAALGALFWVERH
ncbi:LPS export ABC transporter permease LptG [Herminiimonas sp. CN]|uniref:LPS export ABC transporter permease LptG n=1 Tax=Herminiimonas sp. CN TaxID=1349818 RepID=UPI0004735BB1|nr:LPS export ABC transporter permease LptG [Herminiimonas sp. CN]